MKTAKQKLIEFKENFPELTFDNNGYEYLSPEIRDKYKKEIGEISEIMKSLDSDFLEFNNFKPRSDGSFSIRYQGIYDRKTYFKGVCYLNINEIDC